MLKEWQRTGVPFEIITDAGIPVDVSIENARIKHKHSRIKVLRFDGVYHNTAQNYKQKNASMVASVKIADGVIYQSHFAKSMCDEYLGEFDGFQKVIYNGADPKFYDRKWDRSALSKYRYVSFSKWRPHKRLKVIMDCFLQANIKHGELILGGDLSRSGLSNADQKYYFNLPNIHYVGILDQNTMADWLGIATAAIHLCWIDACPNSVVEAITAKVPVICNNNGGTAELVAKSGGYVCNIEPLYDRKPIDLYNPPKFDHQIVANAMVQASQEKRRIVNDHVLISNIANQYKKYILEIGAR
jgi:glycosyltransferase involved in cell wall biosynthesis